jgi:hypothetical protein
MNIKQLILFVLPLLFSNCINAQSKDDTQLWLGVSAKKKLKNGFAGTFQYRIRKIDNISTYKGSYFSFTLEKRLNKSFNLETNYRLAMIDNSNYHRYALGVELQVKTKSNKFTLRPMVQYQQQANAGDLETSYNSKTYFRPRLSWKNDYFNKIEMYTYIEPFYKIDNNINVNWWQNSIGLKYDINKNIRFNPYFIWQPDFTHKSPRSNYILGIDLEFNFK